MRPWFLLLGGPLVWAIHFAAIYAISSVSYVAAGATTGAARAAIAFASAVCLISATALLVVVVRRPPAGAFDAFWRTIAATGALLAIVAIIWQTLPAFAPIEGTAPRGPS